MYVNGDEWFENYFGCLLGLFYKVWLSFGVE